MTQTQYSGQFEEFLDNPAQLKSAIRAEIRLQLKEISTDDREHASQQACSILGQQPVWNDARVVLFYSPLADELDILSLLRQAPYVGKMIALPRFSRERGEYVPCLIENGTISLFKGQFGILEPGPDAPEISSNQLDLTLVPGVAFDLMGHRVGRGKGFYDRLLKHVSGAKCGVGFDQQIWPNLPAEPHDVKLDYVLTPTRWHRCG